MPTFTNIPSTIRKDLLTPIDLTQGTALLRSKLRAVANSLSNINGYKSFFRQELRSLLHPKENGFLGLVATNRVEDIDIDIVGNPIPKIIFGGTDVDIAIVFNQDAFRIILEKDASADGSSVDGWILAVIPYTPFDKLPFGGFLIYLLRRIDDILSKTAALTRYEDHLVRLPVNSVGIGRNDREPEAADEAAIAQPPVAPKAPVAPESPEAPVVEAPVAPAPKKAPAVKPEPEIPEQPLEDEPEAEDVNKNSIEYRAAASFALSPELQEQSQVLKPYDAVGNYANFFQVLKNNLAAAKKEVSKLSAGKEATLKISKSDIVIKVKVARPDDTLVLASVSLVPSDHLNLGKNKGPRFEVSGILDTRIHDTDFEGSTDELPQVSVGTWKWLADYGRLNTLQIVNKIVSDLFEATTHVEHAVKLNSESSSVDHSEATAASKTTHPKLPTEVKVPKAIPEVEIYKKKLADIRKKTDKTGTDTSAYKKVEASKDPKVKEAKELTPEIKVPDVPESGATTVADKLKESLEETPKVKLPKNAAIVPALEARASVSTNLIPLNRWEHTSKDYYRYQPWGRDWNGNLSVISIRKDPVSSLWHVKLYNIGKQFKQLAASFVNPYASIVGGKLVDQAGLGDPFKSPEDAYKGLVSALHQAVNGAQAQQATAKEFDEDYTAEQLTDLELNDMDNDFADTDKSLEDPNDVAEGASGDDADTATPPETPAEPASLETPEEEPEEDVKVDINTALKYRAVAPDKDETELPATLTELFDAAGKGKVPANTVIFVTSGVGLETLVVAKITQRGASDEESSYIIHRYSSKELVPEAALDETDDEDVLKKIKNASEAANQAEALRDIDALFDAYEALVSEDVFDTKDFSDEDSVDYKLPSAKDDLVADLADYAKSSEDEGDAEETEEPSEEDEAEAAFGSALVDLLSYKENPVEAAAEVNAILHAYGEKAEAAFSVLEDRGLFSDASKFPVMETKFYKRGDRQYSTFHMSVASTSEPTLIFVPRTGSYAVASLDELQEEEARG